MPSAASTAVSPLGLTHTAEAYGITKTRKAPLTSFMLAITAGVFIAIGFTFYTTVTVGTGTAPYGLVKFIGGVAFSLGLMLVIVTGAELFTSTVLTSVGYASRKISTLEMIRTWVTVYLGNFVGALLFVALIFAGKVYMQVGGEWGINAMKIAQHKLHHSFGEAIALGIMCNMLVCLAVWLSFSCQNMIEKVLIIILPVAMFVAAGFEHCVANMFMIPLGIIIHSFAGPEFWAATGVDPAAFADLTTSHFVLNNLIPVTIGNIIGGAVMIGFTYWFIHIRPTLKLGEDATPAE
ncbi:formate transporter FocA [Polycladidibacter hongkongensis]|uniref:formate transporter FocA n=1 Tax=Polycladidibacter hongkongensis TaxID=1647556 RepID=UPI000832EA93|nr:formate transporter FocA [Pseudovibrio hongkongensis]